MVKGNTSMEKVVNLYSEWTIRKFLNIINAWLFRACTISLIVGACAWNIWVMVASACGLLASILWYMNFHEDTNRMMRECLALQKELQDQIQNRG